MEGCGSLGRGFKRWGIEESLTASAGAEANIGDAMTFDFRDLNAHARDPTAASGLVNLLMRPMVGVFLTAISTIGLLLKEVSGAVRRLPIGNSLSVILRLQARSIVESDPILGLPKGLQYPYYQGANQADLCYFINLQVDMGVKQSKHLCW